MSCRNVRVLQFTSYIALTEEGNPTDPTVDVKDISKEFRKTFQLQRKRGRLLLWPFRA